MSQRMARSTHGGGVVSIGRAVQRMLVVMAVIGAHLAVGAATAPWAVAAPDAGMGPADYTTLAADCVVGASGLGGPAEPDAGCDEYATDLVERPTVADPDPATPGDYHPWVDIEATRAGFDGTYLYLALDLTAEEPGVGLSGGYGFELDVDDDGAGDFFAAVADGAAIGTVWEQTGVSLYADGDDSVGGADPATAEGAGSQNGYETLDWQTGGTPADVLWTRISPADATVIEVAVLADRIGAPAVVAVRGWSAAGVLPTGVMQLHDEYTEAEFGSPYAASPHHPPATLFDIDTGAAAGGSSLTLVDVGVGVDDASEVCPSVTAGYDATVTNGSAVAADLFDLIATSSQGWQLELFTGSGTTLIATDLTGDGTWDTVDPSYDTDSDGVPDTGTVGAGGATQFEVVVTPGAAAPGTIDVTTLIATSDINGGVDDTAVFTTTVVDCATPLVTVGLAADPASIPEPGGPVTFTVTFDNATPVAINIDGLSEAGFGDLLDPAGKAFSANSCPALAATPIPAGSTASCGFATEVAGAFGDPPATVAVSAAVSVTGGGSATEQAEVQIPFTDALPSIALAVEPSATSVAEPGDEVTFSVTVTNLSGEEATVETLTDDVFGDLTSVVNADLSATTCDLLDGAVLDGTASASCEFTAEVLGAVGDPDHENTVTAGVADDEGNTATAADTVRLPFVPGTAELEGLVFEDADGDGTRDDGEAGLAGIDLAVTDGAGLVMATSSADGSWTVTVESGSVSVAVVPSSVPEGFTLTTGNATQAIDVVAGEVTEAGAIGYQPGVARLEGVVFEDSDADGVHDPGEPGLPGVDITVTDSTGPQVVTTGPGGAWTAGPEPGQVVIAVDDSSVPYGWSLTTGNATQTLAIGAGETAEAEAVGYQPRQASLSGVVFFDGDGDGLHDDGEPALPGVALDISDGDETDRRVTTDAKGAFSAEGLPGGEYTVAVDLATLPTGFVPGTGTLRAADSTAVTVIPGEALALEFDFVGTGTISDVAWVDADADGTPDSDEARIGGARVTASWAGLDGAFGTDDDYTFDSVVTDEDGAFAFGDLPPGEYRVRIDINTVSEDLTLVTLSEVAFTLTAGEQAGSGGFAFASADEALAYTGLSTNALMILALALLAAGVGLLMAGGRIHERYLRARARVTGVD